MTNAGRMDDRISLVAVSKTQPSSTIRSAFNVGQKLFGENYVQEAIEKQVELADLDIEWHFIGPIQSNKTQQIAQHFSWVHGIDRLKIAQRLNDARDAGMPPLQVCIQVNISGEDSKSGVPPEEVAELARALQALPRLRLRGLMAIPAPSSDNAFLHSQFAGVREVYEKLNAQGFALDTLSMGMSDDFAIAIAEGATIVRIGSAIFGARSKPATGSIPPDQQQQSKATTA